MKRVIMSGNEAIARGAYEAGCLVAAAYPGTPSTEILENIGAHYPEIDSRWGSNEKTAMEIASGASLGGVRALSAMKHVGLNVAADPLFTMGYIGVTGGFMVVTADDPGCHSSQNEQDNRLFAPLAKLLMLEPSDSQECLDFTKLAFELSEKFDSPVLFRVTTRVCHSKSLVKLSDRVEVAPIPYVKNFKKNAMLPAHARARHVEVEQKLLAAEEFANTCAVNRIEWGADKKIGVVTSGVSYLHAREAFGDSVSYLKLGMTNPLPRKLISTFCRSVDKIYVIEEGEPYLENAVRALGFDCLGKELVPVLGELDANILRKAFLPEYNKAVYASQVPVPPRPPVLCPGCPHRGFYHVLSKKKKDLIVSSDIGCYTLGGQPPLDAVDTTICMGAGFTAAIGMSTALKIAGDTRKVFGMVGDSTFFHSGITGLVDAVHVDANVCLCVLDNSITAMTGHQENPGTAVTLMNKPAKVIDPVQVVKALVPEDRILIVDPLDHEAMTNAVDTALKAEGLFVIITKRPCVLIKEVRKSLEGKSCKVDAAACKKCKMCLKVGCPAISFKDDHSFIDQSACVGCEYCLQVCKFDAISKVEAK